MASYSFAFIHFIGASTNLLEGPAYNITGASTPTTPLTEADLTIDGSTAVGDAVEYSGSTFYYRGTTDQGGVMISTSPTGAGQTWLLADSNLSGQNVFFQATGPYLYCFLAGSGIATPAGEVAVERLRIGDTVLTAEGRAVPVKWIGRQTVATRFGPAERLMPVRFEAGSLGQGVPLEPLTVTADHGMLVGGVICHAGALVNGTTITRVPLREMGESYTVYHIETEEHEIILANGAPAETFIDNVSRRVFDNYAEFEALYGDVPEMEELPYPRAMSARQVPGWIAAKLVGKAVA
ncbi:Hint domain-containing protein [Nioella aestuarii]|uniref:Hint domain-containing protein n=1 Tax=Nioella aestuarii TaxID=1662864 RepID=UPI003D7F6D52